MVGSTYLVAARVGVAVLAVVVIPNRVKTRGVQLGNSALTTGSRNLRMLEARRGRLSLGPCHEIRKEKQRHATSGELPSSNT